MGAGSGKQSFDNRNCRVSYKNSCAVYCLEAGWLSWLVVCKTMLVVGKSSAVAHTQAIRAGVYLVIGVSLSCCIACMHAALLV